MTLYHFNRKVIWKQNNLKRISRFNFRDLRISKKRFGKTEKIFRKREILI